MTLTPGRKNLRPRRHSSFNPLNAKLNPIWHLLALLGAHHILHIGRIRVKPPSSSHISLPVLKTTRRPYYQKSLVGLQEGKYVNVSTVPIKM